LEAVSKLRVKYILGEIPLSELPNSATHELERFDLGNGSRTLADYERLSGVRFSKKNVEEKAKWGNLEKERFFEDVFSKMMSLIQQTTDTSNGNTQK